jgi:DNA repair protein RadA/Sms
MPKNDVVYVCSDCGNESLKWSGRCNACNAWNTLKEMKAIKLDKRNTVSDGTKKQILTFDKIDTRNHERFSVNIAEFDRVLGGGVIPGSVIILGGDPGIGKSTLALQIAENVENVLYVSGEESAEQIKLRANRLKVRSKKLKQISETNIGSIENHIMTLAKEGLKLVIVDSIQTMYDAEFPSTPGSLVQVRECALKLQQIAKSINVTIILIGHVTKDGNVAGPKTLEHLVDVVLYLEGERYHNTRILRGIKNRFGATDEIGVFEMGEGGFKEISNPSKIFLEERVKDVPGSIVTATMEGTRPFLVEIQALNSSTAFGYPSRTSSGFDLNRLQLLIAVLAKRAGINLSSQDIYLNVVGGFKIKEPACDLAVCLAMISAYKNKTINPELCAFGEIGLSGEIRKVNYFEKRANEAHRLGFNKIIKSKNIYDAVKEAFI